MTHTVELVKADTKTETKIKQPPRLKTLVYITDASTRRGTTFSESVAVIAAINAATLCVDATVTAALAGLLGLRRLPAIAVHIT